MRAFRPGRYAAVADEEDVARVKRANMQIYTARAKAKLPLFDDAPVATERDAGQSDQRSDRLTA